MSKIIYGTLRECVDELWKIIEENDYTYCPRVDFAAVVDEDAENGKEAYESAEGWFGFKDYGDDFNTDTISLCFAHYCGGGVAAMEIDLEHGEDQKEILMNTIGYSTDQCGYGVLEPNDMTVFEIYD